MKPSTPAPPKRVKKPIQMSLDLRSDGNKSFSSFKSPPKFKLRSSVLKSQQVSPTKYGTNDPQQGFSSLPTNKVVFKINKTVQKNSFQSSISKKKVTSAVGTRTHDPSPMNSAGRKVEGETQPPITP